MRVPITPAVKTQHKQSGVWWPAETRKTSLNDLVQVVNTGTAKASMDYGSYRHQEPHFIPNFMNSCHRRRLSVDGERRSWGYSLGSSCIWVPQDYGGLPMRGPEQRDRNPLSIVSLVLNYKR